MIETKAQAKRRVRDAKIERLYKEYKIDGGSLKSAAVEEIAKECRSSITTVNRIVKQLGL
jgi:hypothetical protein